MLIVRNGTAFRPVYAIIHLQSSRGTWYWAVHFSRNGKMFNKRFYEPKYGGSESARLAAIAWRDEMLAKTRPMTMAEFSQKVRSNNTSGVPGVTFHKTARQPEGFWQASLSTAGQRRVSKAFSVIKYGERQAFALAVKARQDMIDQVEDRLFLYSSEALKAAEAHKSIQPVSKVHPQASIKSLKRS